MMTNLFSSFDPSTSMNFQINWISSFIILMIFPMNYWINNSMYNKMYSYMLMNLYKEFLNLSKKNSSMNLIIMISFMYWIMIMNMMGLFPFIFTATSHLTLTFSLSMMMWLLIMLNSWMYFSNLMFSHLVPQNTPSILMPFMVLIESISNIIRPITLSVRLSANMIAGHLLLTLIGNSMMNLNIISMWLIIIPQILLLMLEMSVALIQSYVFTVLMCLYSNEL